MPMVKPKTIDLNNEEKTSIKEMEENPCLKKVIKLVDSRECTLKYEPIRATNPQNNPNIGMVIVAATTRVTTRYLNGFIAETSMASICSETRIEPNSAPMLEPTFPAHINAVTSDAKARTIAIDINEGNQDVAPKSAKEGRDCLVKTMPVINPVSAINGNDFTPIR